MKTKNTLSAEGLTYARPTLRSTLIAARNQGRSLCWRTAPSNQIPGGETLLCRGYNQFAGLPLPDCDSRIQESLRMYNEEVGTGDILKHTEYLVQLHVPLYLEPHHGWGIRPPREVIEDSLPYTYYTSPPSYLEYIAMRSGFHECIHEKRVISLRDIGEGNYYHCFNDIITKIILLRSFHIDEDIPLVISRALYRQKFFQEMLSRSSLAERKWLVIGDEYVFSDETTFCKAMPLTRQYYDEILDLLNSPIPDKNRRVFINRGHLAGRTIINMGEVRQILERYNFEVYDAERLSLAEQMQLFSESRYIVGLHGAGLTNIIFRRDEELSLLEIFPPNNIPPHYYWLASIYGHKYDAIAGFLDQDNQRSIPFTSKVSFSIDPHIFAQRIERLIS